MLIGEIEGPLEYNGTTGDRASFAMPFRPFPRMDALDNDRARFGAGDLPFGVVEFVWVSWSDPEAVGIVPSECIDAVAAGKVLPKGRFTLVVVGDDEHVEVADKVAEP